MKIISVADMIERYVKIEDPLRFELPSEKIISDENIIKTISTMDNNRSITKKKIKKIYVRYGKYRVVKGDSFRSIAKRFSMSTKELMRVNLMDEKSKLKVGDKLRVPFEQKVVDAIVRGEYNIESGDTIYSIAKKFKLDPNELERVNNISSHTLIKVGKKLIIPSKLDKKPVKLAKKKSLASNRRAKVKKSKNIKRLNTFGKKRLRVTATAYSSHKSQTDKTPFLAAWNNRLRPGMKIIAVSRDMLTRYGMRNGTKVRISGLPGYYQVRDKMNKRYKKRIDIYMGLDRRRALRWGRRSVVIYW
jgi:LysM repeat protein